MQTSQLVSDSFFEPAFPHYDSGHVPSHMRPVVIDGCFGWLHVPAEGLCSDTAALICPGLDHDAASGHRAFRQLADGLAAAGYPALRFDYPGTGDSRDPGDAEPWSAWHDSVERAAKWLRAQSGAQRLVLLGLRAGSLLAAAAAARRYDVAGLVLFAPVPRGRPYVGQMRVEARIRAGDSATSAPVMLGTLRLEEKTLGAIAATELRDLPPMRGCRVTVFARETSPALRDCLASWAREGIQPHCQDFAPLEAMLRPTQQADEPDADFAPLLHWLRAELPPTRLAEPHAEIAEPLAPTLALADCRETVMRFGRDRSLSGILCRPNSPARNDLAVVIGNTGGNPHHGFSRGSVALARHLAASGIASLRLDFAGLGDSICRDADGHETPTHVFDMDRVGDMRAAFDALERKGYSRFAVQGLCSGAYHALYAALADVRVCAALLVNLPWFTLRHEPAGPASFANQAMASLGRRGVRSLLLYGAGDAGLKPLERHFGPGGSALDGQHGACVSIVSGWDHELTSPAMRHDAAERMCAVLLTPLDASIAAAGVAVAAQ